jgi:hypothetical protein
MVEPKQVGRDLKQLKEAWDGLDFVMELFPVPRVPRNILTGVSKGQRIVNTRDEAMTYYEAALYEDCYINAYPNYEEMANNGCLPPEFKPVPNHIIIDLDREPFNSDEELETALNTTLQNIKANFTGIIADNPVIVWSGNGYHVHVPLPGFRTPLEDIPELAAFKDDKELPNKFLRWAERTLSNGMADQHHNPSVKSALFRVPGTFNTKTRAAGKDPKVRIVEGMEYVLHKITQEKSLPGDLYFAEIASRLNDKFLNDFLGYMVQEQIDDKVEKLQRRRYDLIHVGSSIGGSSTNWIAWIDQLLKTGVADSRKNLIFWVLAPHLITVRGLDYDKAYSILEAWLDKCNELRQLEPDRNSFRYRIRYCLDTAESQERKPIRFETFKEYYPDVYKSLKLGGGV